MITPGPFKVMPLVPLMAPEMVTILPLAPPELRDMFGPPAPAVKFHGPLNVKPAGLPVMVQFKALVSMLLTAFGMLTAELPCRTRVTVLPKAKEMGPVPKEALLLKPRVPMNDDAPLEKPSWVPPV